MACGGEKSLAKHVESRWRGGASIAAACAAAGSPILERLTAGKGHHDVHLGDDERERLITWMDTYAQLRGSFSDEQERRLLALRERWADLLETP